MSFFLVMLVPDGAGEMVDAPLPDYGPYDKGSEAAKIAKDLTECFGRKVQPRRIAQAGDDWRVRAAEKLANGTLTPLPAKWDLPPINDHFAHVHAGNLIGFFDSEEFGIMGRVTALTAGRYISRFYSDISDDRRRRLIATIDLSGEILFATTPDEITRIYKEGPGSCMDAKECHGSFYDYSCWPTAPYGAGDLAVAYTVNNAGRIQSRCVCWPKKKQFGRCYGDIQRMEAAMLAEGYEFLRTASHHQDWRKFEGARLLKVQHTDPFEYILPYFDDIKYAVDKGDHFVTAAEPPVGAPGVRYCGSGGTSGLATMYRWCPAVEEFELAFGFAYVHGANEKWSSRGISDHAFTCDATDQIWSNDHRVVVYDNGKRCLWSKPHFDLNGEFCAANGRNMPKDEPRLIQPKQDNDPPERRRPIKYGWDLAANYEGPEPNFSPQILADMQQMLEARIEERYLHTFFNSVDAA